jgi:hypothetical protein
MALGRCERQRSGPLLRGGHRGAPHRLGRFRGASARRCGTRPSRRLAAVPLRRRSCRRPGSRLYAASRASMAEHRSGPGSSGSSRTSHQPAPRAHPTRRRSPRARRTPRATDNLRLIPPASSAPTTTATRAIGCSAHAMAEARRGARGRSGAPGTRGRDRPPVARTARGDWPARCRGWCAEDVSDALGLSGAEQRELLHRARANARAALERHWEAVEPTVPEVA